MDVVENLCKVKENGKVKYIYNYRIIKSTISLKYEEEKIDVQAYGIEIERQDIYNGSIINIERDCVKNISPHRHKVHTLLKILYDNVVSPIHLIDIIGEYIDKDITDFDEVYKEIQTL